MAKTQDDIDTVRAKLAALASEIEAAEAELDRVSLAAALGDDQAAGFEAVACLSELHTRRELLQRALVAAEAAEQERLAEARLKANRAQLRAFTAQSAVLQKAMVAYQDAVAGEERAWRLAVAAAAKMRALVPVGERETFNYLFEPPLSRLCDLERRRVGARDLMITTEAPLPGTIAHGEFWKHPPLGEEAARLAKLAVAQFRKAMALPTPEPVASETSGRERPASAAPLEPLAALAPAPDDDGANSNVQLREGVDAAPPLSSLAPSPFPNGNAHPAGSAEHAGFEAALAELQAIKPDDIGRWRG